MFPVSGFYRPLPSLLGIPTYMLQNLFCERSQQDSNLHTTCEGGYYLVSSEAPYH